MRQNLWLAIGYNLLAVPIAAEGSFWLYSDTVLWNGGTLMQHAHERLRLRIPEPFVALNLFRLALEAQRALDAEVKDVGEGPVTDHPRRRLCGSSGALRGIVREG